MKKSSRTVAGIKIRSNVVAGHFPVHGRFKRDHPLGWDLLAENPHGDPGLPDPLTSDVGQFFSDGNLPASLGDRIRNGVNVHMSADYNTGSVMHVNTRSAIKPGQNVPMPKSGKTSEFWERLTVARTTHKPPLSMLQADILKDVAGAASFQSTITKWKTGGPDGRTKPRPEVVEQLALQADVAFEWLYTGRGEMRPLPALDSITHQILEYLAVLAPEDKIEVLKAAITQQTLRHPAVAAQVRQAKQAAEGLSKPTRKAQ